MISFRQNRANLERDLTGLTTVEVFSELIIQVKVDSYFAHGSHRVNNMTFFVSVTFIKNGNP